MNKILKGTCLLLIVTNSLFSSCSGDDQSAGPDILLPTSGYLCARGPSSLSGLDTLYFRFSSGGTQMTGFRSEWAEREDEVHLTNTSAGHVRIEMKTPYVTNGTAYKYLGIYEAPNPSITSFPNHPYQFQLYHEPVPETEFSIERNPDDRTQFTIESTLHKGQFLTTGKWKGHLGIDHPNLVFETNRKNFFFQ